MEIRKNESLKKWNWWKLEGAADYFCQPKNQQELQQALCWAVDKKIPFSVIGGGTNVLISDKGVRGLLISTYHLNKINFQIENNYFKIQAEAGVPKSQLMSLFKKQKLAPAVFLSGLPGDVGGGLMMNAGVGGKDFKPSEFSEITYSVEVMTAQGIKKYSKDDVKWSYRSTLGWPTEFVIFRANFLWPLEKQEDLSENIKSELKKRRASQPLEWPSCGSVFKNPKLQYAGELIERAGLKGLTKGDAMVSKKHGNFIINKGHATAGDIDYLIKEIYKTIKEKFNVSLKTEVCYLGDWNK